MQRIKPVGFAILAVLALSASASASASAEACKKQAGSHKYALCIEGTRVGSPTEIKGEAFTAHLKTGTSARFSGTALNPFDGGEGPITCPGVTSRGTLHSGKGFVSLGNTERTYETCVYETKPLSEKCTFSKFILTKPLSGSLGAHPEELTIKTEVGGTFLESKVLNIKNCPPFGGSFVFRSAESTANVSKCTATEIESEKATHEVNCPASGSYLTDSGTEVALAATETVEISEPEHKGQKFSIIESS
jgi:hypothetical protein